MNWRDLKKGDVVVPIDPSSSPWVVLSVQLNNNGDHTLTYAHLNDATVQTAGDGGDPFSLSVQVIRDGEDVNK